MTRLGVEADGYLVAWDPEDGKAATRFYVHRLAAVAEHGFDAVTCSDIHHRDGVVENNGTDNLEPLPPGRHRGRNLPTLARAD